MKVVINKCYGGFGLSEKALEEYNKLSGNNFATDLKISRTDKDLIRVVEKLKAEANTEYSKLEIVEVPDGINWEISKYDGMETIEARHRSWS